MVATKFLARDLLIEIDASGGYGPANFIPIGGIESLTHAPATTNTDTTDFDSAGAPEHLVAERGDVWTLSGFSKEDAATGERDAGQTAIEGFAKLFAQDAFADYRITSPGGNTITFSASAEVTLPGGAHNDAAAWQAVLTVSGGQSYA